MPNPKGINQYSKANASRNTRADAMRSSRLAAKNVNKAKKSTGRPPKMK